MYRCKLWFEEANLEFGLSNPMEPSKTRILKVMDTYLDPPTYQESRGTLESKYIKHYGDLSPFKREFFAQKMTRDFEQSNKKEKSKQRMFMFILLAMFMVWINVGLKYYYLIKVWIGNLDSILESKVLRERVNRVRIFGKSESESERERFLKLVDNFFKDYEKELNTFIDWNHDGEQLKQTLTKKFYVAEDVTYLDQLLISEFLELFVFYFHQPREREHFDDGGRFYVWLLRFHHIVEWEH